MQHEEIASMVVAALPCPVLGMLGTLEETAAETVFTSHGLMMHVLLHAAYKCGPDVREQHGRAMSVAERELVDTIDALQLPLYPPEGYAAFCAYMRHVLRGSPWVHADVRFVPLEFVGRGDPVHRAACDHARAHDVLYGHADDVGDYTGWPYTDIVAQYVYRIRNETGGS